MPVISGAFSHIVMTNYFVKHLIASVQIMCACYEHFKLYPYESQDSVLSSHLFIAVYLAYFRDVSLFLAAKFNSDAEAETMEQHLRSCT